MLSYQQQQQQQQYGGDRVRIFLFKEYQNVYKLSFYYYHILNSRYYIVIFFPVSLLTFL